MPGFRNPVITDDEGIDHGDPFVLRYLDRYYLYHTSENRGPGIHVHTSVDLVHWDHVGIALEPSSAPGHWAQTALWAPEVMYQDGVFYMYITGTRIDERGEASEDHRRQGVARATDPRGPFEFDEQPLIEHEWTIDGHPLRDEDGVTWLVYNTRERILDPTTGETYLASQTGNVIDELVAPDQLAGHPSIVSFPTEEWEGNGNFYWNEGAWVLKRAGRYHLLYSGSDYRGRGYAVGLLSASHPRGPWIKHPDNPILRSGERIVGPGHPSVAFAPDNVTPYLVYHAYVDDAAHGRKVHIDRVQWRAEMPVIGEPAGSPTEWSQRSPAQPVYDPDVATWVADFWTSRAQVEVAGERVALPGTAMRRVRAMNALDSLRVWVDDRLVHQVPPRGAFSLDGDEDIHALGVTSILDDELEHVLAPGEEHAWPWPGVGVAEVTVAIRGCVAVSVGDSQVRVSHPDDRFELFRMYGAPCGDVRIRALGGAAVVRDVMIVARERSWALDEPQRTPAIEPRSTVAPSS